MTATYTVGDLERPLSGTLTDGGAPLDLSPASSVAVHVKRPDGTVVSHPATVDTPVTGAWSMTWEAGDLTISGQHWVEVQVTWPGGRPQTFGPKPFNVRGQFA